MAEGTSVPCGPQARQALFGEKTIGTTTTTTIFLQLNAARADSTLGVRLRRQALTSCETDLVI